MMRPRYDDQDNSYFRVGPTVEVISWKKKLKNIPLRTVYYYTASQTISLKINLKGTICIYIKMA